MIQWRRRPQPRERRRVGATTSPRRPPLESGSDPGRAPRRVVGPETAHGGPIEGVTGPHGMAGGRRFATPRSPARLTAQKPDRATGATTDRFVAWLIGVAADAPRIAMVGLTSPGGLHIGGCSGSILHPRLLAAARPPRDSYGAWRSTLGAWPTTVIANAPAAPALAVARRPGPGRRPTPFPTGEGRRPRLLPDFQGLSVAEVRQITARHGLAVEISGNGRAVAQDPPPGTVVVARGARVRVRFGAAGDEI
jgi:hypothetical protein